MRVTRLELSGIGPFDGAIFEMPPPPEGTKGELWLFEGPNGCGKTTVAQAIAIAAYPHVLSAAPAWTTRPDHAAWKQRFRAADALARIDVEHGGETHCASVGRDTTELKGRKLGMAGAFGDILNMLTSQPEERRFAPPGWAAYSFHGGQSTPSLETYGPKEMKDLQQGLSFGDKSAAGDLGQLLVNLDYRRMRSAQHAPVADSAERREKLQRAAHANEAALARMAEAFSRVLGRRVEFVFDVDTVVPRILFDGEAVPLEALGEGLRATVAWLADLLVRIELAAWEGSPENPYEKDFWLILDEVEVNLHPQMQARLFPALRGLFPNARIYATTHSPFAVASVGEGHVFPIRPDRRTRRVTGLQRPVALEHGQSLSWVAEEIFDVSSMFLDQETQERLSTHDRFVRALGEKKPIDWAAFLANRKWLMALNEEVKTIVAMREVSVRRAVQDRVDEAAP